MFRLVAKYHTFGNSVSSNPHIVMANAPTPHTPPPPGNTRLQPSFAERWAKTIIITVGLLLLIGWAARTPTGQGIIMTAIGVKDEITGQDGGPPPKSVVEEEPKSRGPRPTDETAVHEGKTYHITTKTDLALGSIRDKAFLSAPQKLLRDGVEVTAMTISIKNSKGAVVPLYASETDMPHIDIFPNEKRGKWSRMPSGKPNLYIWVLVLDDPSVAKTP
jgi:hypothetical protein